MDIGLGILVLAGIFLLYRVGAIKLAQVSSEVLVKTTETSLKVYETKVAEKATRAYGKIAIKLADEDIDRSSYKSVMRQIKKLDKEVAE